jgi:hypothetical protein
MSNILLLSILVFLCGMVFAFVAIALLVFWSYDDE